MATLPVTTYRAASPAARRTARLRAPFGRLALWLRVAARHDALDVALARGAHPAANRLLATRAAQLERMRHRTILARTLRRIVAEAGPAHGAPHPGVIIARAQVRADAEHLIALADRLAYPQPVDSVAGIAIAHRLITDGLSSPIYAPCEPHTLRRLARRALSELGPMD
jgi:hypothetical protein